MELAGLAPTAEKNPPAGRFLSLTAQPALTPEELGSYLAARPAAGAAPLGRLRAADAGSYPLEIRAADLARRMIAAKIHRADAVFLSILSTRVPPAADRRRRPTELFLAWRTAALLLTRADYLGSIALPGGSENRVFARGEDAVLIAWNDRPTQEVLYLGPQIRQLDLWGRPRRTRPRGPAQGLSLTPLPVYVTGLHLAIARWRLDCDLARRQIPSICGQAHENMLHPEEPFSRERDGAGRAHRAGRLDDRAPPVRSPPDPRRVFGTAPANHPRARRHSGARSRAPISSSRPIASIASVPIDRSKWAWATCPWKRGPSSTTAASCWSSSGSPTRAIARRVSRCQLFAPARQIQTVDVLDLTPGRDVRSYVLPGGEEHPGANALAAGGGNRRAPDPELPILCGAMSHASPRIHCPVPPTTGSPATGRGVGQRRPAGGRSGPSGPRTMTCLTITPATAAEAVREAVDLVVSHHPLPFQPLARLTAETTAGRLLLGLAGGRVAVYSPHTAWDSAAEGINQQLARLLVLRRNHPLGPVRRRTRHRPRRLARRAARAGPTRRTREGVARAGARAGCGAVRPIGSHGCRGLRRGR